MIRFTKAWLRVGTISKTFETIMFWFFVCQSVSNKFNGVICFKRGFPSICASFVFELLLSLLLSELCMRLAARLCIMTPEWMTLWEVSEFWNECLWIRTPKVWTGQFGPMNNCTAVRHCRCSIWQLATKRWNIMVVIIALLVLEYNLYDFHSLFKRSRALAVRRPWQQGKHASTHNGDSWGQYPKAPCQKACNRVPLPKSPPKFCTSRWVTQSKRRASWNRFPISISCPNGSI